MPVGWSAARGSPVCRSWLPIILRTRFNSPGSMSPGPPSKLPPLFPLTLNQKWRIRTSTSCSSSCPIHSSTLLISDFLGFHGHRKHKSPRVVGTAIASAPDSFKTAARVSKCVSSWRIYISEVNTILLHWWVPYCLHKRCSQTWIT